MSLWVERRQMIEFQERNWRKSGVREVAAGGREDDVQILIGNDQKECVRERSRPEVQRKS